LKILYTFNSLTSHLYTVSQKMVHQTYGDNFVNS